MFLSDRLITVCIIAVYITLSTVGEMNFVFQTGDKMMSCWLVGRLVVLVFYGPSTHFRSFQARSVNPATLFLGKPPRQFTST